jgi:hypothetical protein
MMVAVTAARINTATAATAAGRGSSHRTCRCFSQGRLTRDAGGGASAWSSTAATRSKAANDDTKPATSTSSPVSADSIARTSSTVRSCDNSVTAR